MKRLEAPVKVGVVGYGYAGRSFHTYLVGLADGLSLHAVATRDSDRRARAAAERGVRTYETLDQMLEDDEVQLVVLATPHDVHVEQAIQCAQAGRHVVTDKVMCLATAEADRMIEAARRHDVLLSVFHNRRWDGDYLTIREAVKSGLLGRPLLFEAGVWGYGMPRGWRGEMGRGGGILYDWGAHLVDQAVQLVPSPVESVFGTAQFERAGTDIESYGRCQIRFANGVLYSVEVTNLARLGKPRWLVIGEHGALIKEGLDPQEEAMNRGVIEQAREDPAKRARIKTELHGRPVEMVLDTIPGNWKTFYQNIADVLTKGAELAVTPESVRANVAVLEAYSRSVRSGQPEKPVD